MPQSMKQALSGSTAAVAFIITTGFAAPANATDDFGQHVRDCAQTHGFDGEMNPGMHQGRYGGVPSMTC